MMTVWVAHLIGCTRTTRRNCLLGSPAKRDRSISAHQVHVDTTSFSVSGAYSSTDERMQEPGTSEEALEAETALIAITYSFSRDHREDLKQWMIALATTTTVMCRCSCSR